MVLNVKIVDRTRLMMAEYAEAILLVESRRISRFWIFSCFQRKAVSERVYFAIHRGIRTKFVWFESTEAEKSSPHLKTTRLVVLSDEGQFGDNQMMPTTSACFDSEMSVG